MRLHILAVSALIIFCCSPLWADSFAHEGSRAVQAVNSLSIVDPTVYGSRPGYIDNATLVIEPHGAYAEQSLYLNYTDHNQFSSYSQLEIVHRFGLPAGSTVNDMWLWIGDSVMQAIVIDTWTARHIYDSIVSKHRDPAFLAKIGDQYELHIYPLRSGGHRKVKINFITPIQWTGAEGTITLPMRFLLANNAATKPLTVLFRERDSSWGTPVFVETPEVNFAPGSDTLGYNFRKCNFANVSSITDLHLKIRTTFQEGLFFSSNERINNPTYFQIGFVPGSLFSAHADTTPRQAIVGIDLSGSRGGGLAGTLSNISGALKSALRPVDSVRFVAGGAGMVRTEVSAPEAATGAAIDTMLATFAASPLAHAIDSVSLPNLLFCDDLAVTCWGFQGINAFATVTNTSTLVSALSKITRANTVAAYNYGYEEVGGTTTNLAAIIDRLDSLFRNGGRFVGYFDYNRASSNEPLGPHYFSGLTTTRRADGSITLYRNINGNIGRYLPEQIVHYGVDFLKFAPDTSIKVELADVAGNPVMISKRVHRGLIIISSIWSFRDDDAIKKIIGLPLLGLNAHPGGVQQLPALLDTVRTLNDRLHAQKVLLFSNGDSLTDVASSRMWAGNYLSGYTSRPFFCSINLLDGAAFTPPYLTDNLVQYYGSGYLQKALADSTQGIHFESHNTDWLSIRSALAFNASPAITRFSMSIAVDDSTGQVDDAREVQPNPADPNKSRFFVGSTNAQRSLTFNFNATFAGLSDSQTVRKQYLLSHDSTKNEPIILAMLANEQINDIFLKMSQVAHPDTADTLRIVHLAVRHRLLCDFTAMLALEPHDTIQFMHNPFDESGFVTGVTADNELPDSLGIDVFPNPFNSTTTFRIAVAKPSDVQLAVYNILGQRVMEYHRDGVSAGVTKFRWDGLDGENRPVGSGIYFARLMVKNLATGAMEVRTKKLLVVK